MGLVTLFSFHDVYLPDFALTLADRALLYNCYIK